VLDAVGFFPRGNGQKLAAFASNTFGGSIGGPVYFPKLYDGRNRTFFFFNYEGAREGNGNNYSGSQPTPRMRAGDFSEVASPIYDPFSVRSVNGVPMRDPFPGNIIPLSMQDPVARNIMTYYPQPNKAPPNPATPWVQNFTTTTKWPRSYDPIVVKLDHQFSPKHQAFARLNYGIGRLVFVFDFDGLATPSRNRVRRPHFGISLSDTYSISPRTTLDFRLGYARGKEERRPWSDGFDLTSLGFPTSFQNLVQSRSFPIIRVTGFQGLAGSEYMEQPGDTWTLQPSISMQRGKHLFKTGGEGRLLRGHYFFNTATSGTFSFNQASTGGPRADVPGAGTGFAMASLLLGTGTGSIDFNSGVSIQNLYYGLFLQDDYRVSPKLTLNLGLRWEYEGPRTERYDRSTRGFAYGTASPLQVPGLNLRGGLLYAGVNGQPRGLYDPDRNNFAPRVGFAYSLSRKTVLRGGYALSYIPVVGSVEPTGFSNTTPLVNSTDGGITVRDRLSNPFPNGLLQPIGSSQGLATLIGQGVTFVEPSDRIPMFHNWQFNVQRELPSSMLVEVAYVGSRGIKIVSANEELNQLHPSFYSMGNALLQTVDNPFFGVITSGPLSGRTIQRQQLLRPYPQFTSVRRINPAYGNTSYHAMQVRFEKRLKHGITALVSYTISKSIGDLTFAQNAYDRRAERAINEFDVPQRLTISGAWELPFGRNRYVLSNIPRAADLLLGGWQLSTFCTFQAGFGQTFSNSRSTLFVSGAGTQRPNVIGDPSSGISGSHTSRLGRYFNTAAFAQPADFTFGNLAARAHTVRNPGMDNVNLTLSKDFRVSERWKVQFRASSFNLLNHPVFTGPSTTFGDASFGRVSNQNNLSRQTEFALRVMF